MCRLPKQPGKSLCGKGFVPCKNEYPNLCSSQWTRRTNNEILNWEDYIEVLGLWWRRILKALGNLFTEEPGYSGLFKKDWKIKWQCKVKLKVLRTKQKERQKDSALHANPVVYKPHFIT